MAKYLVSHLHRITSAYIILGLISLIIPLLSLSNIFISGGAIISMLAEPG